MRSCPLRRVMRGGLLFALAASVVGAAVAGEPAADATLKGFPEQPAVTRHVIRIDGQTLDYQVTAGRLPVAEPSGKVVAQMFFVAYVRRGVEEPSRRPLMFAFNGGPGAAALWLHVGGLGPRRALLGDDGTRLPRRFRLEDNPWTWLPFADLVFVDPVGTGYSRPEDGVDADRFYSIEGDAEACARFIRLYVTKYDRWLSPKFLVGESYGTTRSAVLSHYLQSKDGMDLAGVVLLSSALNFETFMAQPGNDVAYALALPSYAATAWYHKKLSGRLQADLDKTLDEVRRFAVDRYLPALARGDALGDEDRQRVARRLAAYTGLAEEYIRRSELRVSQPQFIKQLLRDRDETVGLLDGRVVAEADSELGEYPRNDPALFLVVGPYMAAWQHYVAEELDYRTDLPYEYLSTQANQSWEWGSARGGFVDVSDKLRTAMRSNYRMRALFAAGVYDLTTPWFSQEYTVRHLGLPERLRDHVSFHAYPSGHQIYTTDEALRKLTADVASFVRGCPACGSAEL